MSELGTQERDAADVGSPDDDASHVAQGWDEPPAASPRRHRRRRRRVIALTGVGALVVGWIGWASPLTLVEHVVVEAPRGISQESIRLSSGISAQDHVPAVNAAKVRLAIMSAIPAVADVQVSRSLPDTITLLVSARTALAAVDAGKGYYLMDADGVIYDKVASVGKRVPIVKAGTDLGRDTARGVLLSLPEDLRAKVRRVSAKTRDDVTLVLSDGATVRWGSPQDAELKARVLAGLVVVKAEHYDVSAPLQPTTMGGSLGAEAGGQG